MKIVENYLNSLQRYLPEDIRDEVKQELESSILDQIDDKQEELGRDLSHDEVEQLLIAFGHPMKVANAYSPNQELVSSEYFPIYKKSLELTLAIVLIVTLLLKLPFIFSDSNFVTILIKIFWDFVVNGVWVFAWVTLLFWILQTNNVNIDSVYKWSARELSSAQPKLKISRLESLFEITVYLIFLAWWNGATSWPLVDVFEQLDTVVQLSTEWELVYWSVNIIVALGIVVDCIKYINAGWNKITLYANILLNFASLMVLYQMLSFKTFVTFVENPEGKIPLDISMGHAESLVLSVLGVIAVIIVFDIFSNYKKLTYK